MKEWKIEQGYPLHQHLLFWLVVFCCYCIANIEDHQTVSENLVTYATKVTIQAGVAYYLWLFALPRYFKTGKVRSLIWPILLMLILLQVVAESRIIFLMEPTYPYTYRNNIARNEEVPILLRYLNGITIFFRNPAIYLPPAVGLMALQYLQKQRNLAELKEQQKNNELLALKNQMNPHFLFNTLNNLYTLALKKSDKTPEVIAKLSEILDYMLYRCNEAQVPIQREIELLENYLGLEKVRYGKRIDIQFDHQIAADVKIAPLLLLHFVENAFKHGVRQELDQADIQIKLQASDDEIDFSIRNSIPNDSQESSSETEGIGLQNIRRQLQLLYPKRHQLEIRKERSRFGVELKLRLD